MIHFEKSIPHISYCVIKHNIFTSTACHQVICSQYCTKQNNKQKVQIYVLVIKY